MRLGALSDFPKETGGFQPKAMSFVGDPKNPDSVELAYVHTTGGTSTDWLSPEAMFVVWSNHCTHVGCPVQTSSLGFSCPCHGSQFDQRGDRVLGPAVRPLDRFQWEIRHRSEVWLTHRWSVGIQGARRLLLPGQAAGPAAHGRRLRGGRKRALPGGDLPLVAPAWQTNPVPGTDQTAGTPASPSRHTFRRAYRWSPRRRQLPPWRRWPTSTSWPWRFRWPRRPCRRRPARVPGARQNLLPSPPPRPERGRRDRRAARRRADVPGGRCRRKELLLTDDRGIYFTTPHFNGYPAILVRIPDLDRLDRDELRDSSPSVAHPRAERAAKAWLAENTATDD